MDLKFPHHENEIAQSCGASGHAFVNLWMHNGFLTVDDTKMSKSLGNFFTIREVVPRLRHPEVLRAFLLLSHYRGPINYSTVQLQQADASLTRLYTALRGLVPDTQLRRGAASAAFEAALDDDFNTPEAFAVLQGLARDINSARALGDEAAARALGTELRALAGILGVLSATPEQWFQAHTADFADIPEAKSAIGDEQIEAQINARLAARAGRDFAEADRIRKQLADAGITLEDQPGGRTLWRRS
jgi:cysteinyl-tRNA synthetase